MTDIKRTETETRALSESIGFIFIFAAVVSMAAIVYTTGFADLQDTRDFEQANNAERAFDVLGANLQDVSQRGAPSRATEVKVEDAELYTGAPVWTNVTVADSNDEMNNDSVTGGIEPIVYATGDDTIVYHNGAVFRESSSGETMIREPSFSISDDRVLMPMIRTYSDEHQSIAGSDIVLVRAINTHSNNIPDVARPPEDAETYDVTVRMYTERAELWKGYFEEEGFENCEISEVEDFYGEELECTMEEVDHAQVSSVDVRIFFE